MGLTEEIRRMLESIRISSAGDANRAVNTVVSVDDIPDLDSALNDTLKNDVDFSRDVTDQKRKLNELRTGNVGDIQKLSKEQFGNIRSIATDPFGFMTRTILRKIRSGAGILFIVAIATEVAKFLILELFKPGRPFDIRFREEIDKQVVKFLERKEQQELRQGFRSIITTTIGGLRGNSLRNQVGGNFYTPDRIPPRFIDPSFISAPNFSTRDHRKKSFQDVGPGAARGGRG